MHIGQKEEKFVCLLVNDLEMKTVETEKYLGDLISKEAKNDENVAEKWKKGIGLISQVISMLKEISLGQHYFQIGLLLRDSNIINGILFNSEIWYGVNTKQIEKLENFDEIYLRNF